MSISTEALYGALAEEIYRRNPADQALTLAEINNASGAGLQSVGDQGNFGVSGAQALAVPQWMGQSVVLHADGTQDIYLYAADGFVARVLQDPNGNAVIVFRGTDSGTSIAASSIPLLASASNTDSGDQQTNYALTGGTTNLNATQLRDALALTNAVIAATGDPDKVTVVGQSLGGGLASLVTGILGVQSYVYDPAPFDNEFLALAYADAATKTMAQFGLPPGSIVINNGFFSPTAATLGIATEPTPVFFDTLDPNGASTSANPAVQAYFDSTWQGTFAQYQINATTKIQAYRLTGEALSSVPINNVTAFPEPVTSIDLGSANSVSLHHETPLALTLKWEGTGTAFESLTTPDVALRNALFNGVGTFDSGTGTIASLFISTTPISGRDTHARTDPATINPLNGGSPFTDTSALGPEQQTTSVLFRSLWLDDSFYQEFYTRFLTIDVGTAGTGIDSANFAASTIHTGLVDLGIEVVRDALTPANPTSVVTDTGKYVFDNVQGADVGGLADGYAIIHMADIKNGDYGGAIAIDTAFLGIVKANTGTDYVYKPVPGMFTDPTVVPDLPWKVLVVQAGSDTDPMTYAPLGADISLSHMIVGGANGNTITASQAGDYIIGGAGDDKFILGDGYVNGDGNGSFVIGGGGYDTVDYSHDTNAINMTLDGTATDYQVSTDSMGIRQDYLYGISYIIGPSLPNDAAHKNTFDFTGAPVGSDDELTLNGGDNDIKVSTTASLDVNGAVGTDTLYLSQDFDAYAVSGSSADVVIQDIATGAIYETTDVTDFAFLDRYYTIQALFEIPEYNLYNQHSRSYPDTNWTGGIGTSDLDIDYTIWMQGRATSDNYHAEILSASHLTFVGDLSTMMIAYKADGQSYRNDGTSYNFIFQHVGDIAQVGTPTIVSTGGIFYDPITDEDYSSNPGGAFISTATSIDFNYAVDPDLLAAAPKGLFTDDWVVTATDQNGNAYSWDFNPQIQGLGNTTTLAAATPFILNAIPTLENAGDQLAATATMAFADTDQLDHHPVVKITYLSGTEIGALTADLTTDSTGSGSGSLTLTFSIDDATWQSFRQATVVNEVFQIEIDDGLGGVATKSVTVALVLPVAPTGGDGQNLSVGAGLYQRGANTTIAVNAPNGETDLNLGPSAVVTVQSANTILKMASQDFSLTVAGENAEIYLSQNVADFPISKIGNQFTFSYAGQAAEVINDNGSATYHFLDSTLSSGQIGSYAATTADVMSMSGTTQSAVAAAANDGLDSNILGHISFIDSDADNAHSLATPIFVSSDGGSSPVGVFEAAILSDTTSNGTAGEIQWSYDAVDSSLYSLFKSQPVHETWQISLDNGHGGVTTQDVIITLNGSTDHAPVITSAPSSFVITETPNVTGSTTLDQQTATISFTDADSSDLPTASIGDVAAVYTDATENQKTLTADQIFTLESALSISPVAGNTNNGSTTLAFSIADASMDFLAQGETVVLTSTVTVDDHHGGTVSTPVTVTINGANDLPVITSTPQAAAAIASDSGTTFATGDIGFTDADLSDTHAVSDQIIAGADPLVTAGSFAAAIQADTTGSGAGGDIYWSYAANTVSLNALQDGQTAEATYAVTVSDGHGGTATQDVTINLTRPADQTVITETDLQPFTGETSPAMAYGISYFNDADLNDVHSTSAVLIASDDSGSPLGTMTAVIAQDTTGTGTDGVLYWEYDADNNLVQSLNPGQVVDETYAVSLDDGHGGIQTQDYTIAIHNEHPTITQADTTATFTYLTAPATGTIAFTGEDPADVNQARADDIGYQTVNMISTDYTGSNGLAAGTQLGELVVSTAYKTPGDYADGTVTWTYQADGLNPGSPPGDESSLWYLDPGQVVHETYQIAIGNADSGWTYQDVTITIDSADQAPTITYATPAGAITEVTGPTASTATDTQSGIINFYDLDPADRPTATIDAQSAVYTDANGTVQMLSSDQLVAIEAGLTISSESDNANGGTINWNYSIANSAIEFLGQGETVTLSSDILIDDHRGDTVSTPVTITLAGANDLPVITGSSNTADVTENASAPATVEIATGTITFNDGDQTDTHAVTVAFVPDSADDAQLGTLTTVLASDDAGSTDGIINWDYAVNDTALANLAPGTTQTETYAVNVSDGHGGTVTQDVTVNLHAPALPPGPTDIEFVAPTTVAFDATEYVNTHNVIGQVKATGADTTAQITYGLVGDSASDFSIDQQGNLALLDNSALDYGYWHNAVETAFGGNLTDAQIDAKFATGFLNDPEDAAAVAQLTTEFDGTPYEVQIQATDANGQSITKTAFVDVHDQAHDYANYGLPTITPVSELTPVGTVVGSLIGNLEANEPYGTPGFYDPTGHFTDVGGLIETARPLDYASQSEYDFPVYILTPPSAQQPYWTDTYDTLPIEVTSANIQPGNPSDWSYTPVVNETPEFPANDVLIGNLTVPGVSNVSIMIDSQPDSNGIVESDAFQIRDNPDGTESLWLIGGGYLNRNTLGPSGVLDLTLDGIVQNGSTVTEVQIPVSLTVDNVDHGISQPYLSAQFYAGIAPSDQFGPGLGQAYGDLGAFTQDIYDGHYSFSLVAGTDDDSSFVIANQFEDPYGDISANIAPTATLENRPYIVDIEVSGTDTGDTYDQVFQETISTLPTPSIDNAPVFAVTSETVVASHDEPPSNLAPGWGVSGDHVWATGTLAFSDPDAGDTHFAGEDQMSSNWSGGQYGGELVTWIIQDSTPTTDGELGWAYFNDDTLLTPGQEIQVNLPVTVTDSRGATAVSNIDLDVVGVNHASWSEGPQITTAIVAEDPDAGNIAVGSFLNEYAFGKTQFIDEDPGQQASLTISSNIAVASAFDTDGLTPLMLTDTQIAALEEGFNPSNTIDPSSGYTSWTYQLNDTTDSFLTHGQIANLVIDITANDQHGGVTTQDFDLTVHGQDQAAEYVYSDGLVNFLNSTLSPGTTSISDTVDFTDSDVGDIHSVSPDFRYSSESSGTNELQQYGTLVASVTQEPTSSNPDGTIAWSYDANPAMVATLSQGQTATDHFLDTVSDNFGASWQSSTSVTVTGVNTAPVIASGGTATAALSVDPAHAAGDHELAAGTIDFSDANWDDTHIVSATFVSSDGTNAPLGNFTDNLVSNTAHTGGLGVGGTGGQIGWNYDVSDAALATIAAGTVVHETFDVAVTDDHGATAHQQVILNLSHLPVAA